MSEKIKTCPICNGDSITMIARADMNPFKHGIECSNTDCPAPLRTKLFRTFNEAIAAWNTRAAPLMKKWEWMSDNNGSFRFTRTLTAAEIITTAEGFHAYVNGRDCGFHKCLEAAKKACFDFVVEKVSSWYE